ncbi:MAG: hypothetical protein V7L27_32105, partial [Nostoc sp.]|uniref:hypothetical protein n=1 Tax=Nostoc sp. TaxID=1180 RepID=UPI002FFA146B
MQPEQIPLQMFTWFVFQHSIKNPKSGFSPSIPTTFRFSIRRVHAFHRATTASSGARITIIGNLDTTSDRFVSSIVVPQLKDDSESDSLVYSH